MKRTLAIVGALVLVGLVIAVGFKYWQRRPASQTITVAQAAKTLLYLPLYVAEDKGYLREEGLAVRIITSGGDAQAFAALASGQAEFAQGDPTFVAISHERGGPGKVIAGVLDRVAFWGVTFDKTIQPFTDPVRFRGMTVVTYPEPNTAYVVQKSLVQRAGLRLGEDTSIVQATFGTELGPLEKGVASVAVSIEPTVSQALAAGGTEVFSYPKAWGPFLLTGLMTTDEFATANPDVVRGVVRAYEQALALIAQQDEQVVVVGQRYFPELSAEIIRSAVERLRREAVFPEHAAVDLESWRSAVKLRADIGDIKSTAHDDAVDNTYALDAQGK